MNVIKYGIASLILCLWSSLGFAQGTLPLALTQQFSFTNCATFTNACGTPLIGGLLYFFQVGTVGTPQQSFQDTALTIPNPNPLVLDANGRIPPFFLANGSIHVRLTDASGVVQFDYPNMLVIGPSGGGGGGSSIDPTTIAATGDYKWRPTTEFVTGWVKANAQTIGSATSGATGRANSDTQALFVYEWTICPDAHCPVLGGRGGSALADFNANKQLTLPDCRSRVCGVGLDDMGNAAAGRMLAGNVTSGGGDGVTTPGASGGEANHALSIAELAAHNHTATDSGHTHNVTADDNTNVIGGVNGGNAGSFALFSTSSPAHTITSTVGTANITVANTGSGTAHNTMPPFQLGTWYLKL
jgi:microcystin-dependent protein